MDAVLGRVSQGLSDVSSGAYKMVFSKNNLTSENFWLAMPVVGDIYMLGMIFSENMGWEQIGVQGQATTQREYVELNDKNAKRFFNYALVKVVSYFVLGVLSALPLIGALAAATSTFSYVLYVAVILTQAYFYNHNIAQRARLAAE